MNKTDTLVAENIRLKAENKHLRTLLARHGIMIEQGESKNIAIQRLALYRSFFRGRQDVYAQRWYTKDGQKQYSPMVKWEYRHLNKKERQAATKRGEKIYEPLDDAALIRHLKRNEGRKNYAYGLYLIVNDNECYIAAMDFDGTSWKKDITAVIDTVEEHKFPYLVECSQSGEGAHLWFFFVDAIKAVKARQFCSSLLTLTMERYPMLAMQSYDRILPSQDRITVQGFGSLIALPLEGEARQNHRTVFLDRNLNVQADPWQVLRKLRKIEENTIDTFFTSIGPSFDTGQMGMDASKATLPLFKKTDHNVEEAIPKTAEVILREGLSIPIAGLTSSLINELKRIASFHNPEFYKAQKMRFSTWDKPRIISCAELEEGVMTLPRGCIDAALDVFARAGINAILDDQRSEGESIDLSFNGVLRDEQQEVIDEMSRHSNGVLSAPTGFGKTVIAAALISRFKCSALVIVHTRPLLLQWKERIYEFLGIAPGLLGGGKNSLTGQIDIAVINSLTQEQYHTTVERYGLVIVDECHHVAAISYEQVLKRVRAKNVYGLTATPMRSDGHHDIIFMQCGPIVKRIDQKIWRQQGAFDGKVVTRFTSFRCDYQRLSIQEVYEKLSQDDERNLLLASDIVAHAEENRSILILSNRLKHLDRLQELLAKRGLETLLMSGSQSVKEKRRVQEYLDELKAQGRPALILSTGKYIGEGFDFPTLDTLILASPIAWRGSITQYVGRVSRIHEGKSDILVLDYVDFKIPVLNRMFAKRVRAFKKEGFAITQFGQQPDDDLLYTDQTYWAPLLRDLKNARGPIMFSAPYVSISKIQQLLPFLRELSESKKVVMRLPTKSNISLLATSGIAIQQTSKETVNCILIDERILWYGSINIFGAANEDDTLLRIEDPTYAAEVIRWVENEQIDAQRENLL